MVRATRAYVAGFGTAGSLLAGAAILFVLASAVVSFRGWPQVGSQPSAASVVVKPTQVSGTSSTQRRLVAAVAASRAAVAGHSVAQTAPTKRGSSNNGTGSVTIVSRQASSWTVHNGRTVPQPPSGPSGGGPPSGGGTSTGGIGGTVGQTAGSLGGTVTSTGANLGGTVTAVAGTVAGQVGRISPELGGLVSRAGQAVGGTVSSLTGAAGGTLSSAGNAVGGLLGSITHH
jgi:hypothetical protein